YQGSLALDAAETARIEELRNRFDKVFCRRCDYCQPCSEEIPIQLILSVRSALKRFGKDFLSQGWPKDAIAKARNCSQCGECLDRCPYQLPIPDLIKENLEWVDEQLKP
ncbi:MAG: 4Fe-4S dicluster domain-containing protein, partial [Proteobacteria bacterium]|nr:4Fe-4S dicluster domain-containing protein [Pseudomonadota bacterium]